MKVSMDGPNDISSLSKKKKKKWIRKITPITDKIVTCYLHVIDNALFNSLWKMDSDIDKFALDVH